MCKRHVSPDVAKQTVMDSAKANLVKNVMKQSTCATESPSFGCATCGRTFRSRHAVNAHQRAHLRARSREKCTAAMSTRSRNRNERINKTVGEKPVEPESDAANVEDFKAVEATDEASMISTPDSPNGGSPNVVAGTDPGEDEDIQFVDATDEELRPSARVYNSEIAGAVFRLEKNVPLVADDTNPKRPMPTTTLTSAATEKMVLALAELNDDEIMQLDLAGVPELSPRRQPMKQEAIMRTHRKHTTSIVGAIPPSSSVRDFGKATFSPDGMLAFFTDALGTPYTFELLNVIRQMVDGSTTEIRIYHCKACVQTANRLGMGVDLPRVKTANGHFVDIDPARPQGMLCLPKIPAPFLALSC
ncbi:hypothetical protein AAVH_29428 [Aphelenchoides avenae]|nr:hypothetical protein AAVH_29428 [Aphelenchus avenae]